MKKLLSVTIMVAFLVSAYGEEESWSNVFQRALMNYYRGEYNKAYDLVKESIKEDVPGGEVHRCIALMRKSFVKMNDMVEPVFEMNLKAKESIKMLESGEEGCENPGQLVVLAALQYHRTYDSNIPSRSTLDLIIEGKSVWRDWAIWERGRLLAQKAVSSREEYGVVQYTVGEEVRYGCLDDFPSITISARVAEGLLRENPSSYMGETIRKELYYYRTMSIRRNIAQLLRNEWGDPLRDDIFPLSPVQIELLERMNEEMENVGGEFSDKVLEIEDARARLDEWLWDGRGSSQDVIRGYLDKLCDYGGILDEDVLVWLKELPSPEARTYQVVEEKQ